MSFAFVQSRRPWCARAGFTLIELLVVIGVVAVLLALALPAVQKVRTAAAAARCSSNLRQLVLACHACHDTHGRMPPAWDWFPGLNTTGGSAGIGPLFFHLLPFVEQDNLYKTSRFTAASPPQDYFDFGHNKELQQRQLPLYNCPLDPTLPGQAGAPGVAPIAGSSYAGNFLVFGKADAAAVAVSPFGRPELSRSFPDGTSTTLLLGEKYAVVGVEPAPDGQGGQVSRGGCHWDYWGQNSYAAFFALYDPLWTAPDSVGPVPAVPNDSRDSRPQVRPDPNAPATNPGRCSTGHAGGMNAAWADGSVRPVAASIDRPAWWALVTPAGGEVVSTD